MLVTTACISLLASVMTARVMIRSKNPSITFYSGLSFLIFLALSGILWANVLGIYYSW